jgi:hypothetical protein
MSNGFLVLLSDKQKKELKRLAKINKKNMSDMIRHLIKEEAKCSKSPASKK